MRICLTSTYFPPEGTGGIPRQRQILAHALDRLGHEIHVIVQGKKMSSMIQDNVVVHSIPAVAPPLTFSKKYLSINSLLTHSHAIREQVRIINQEQPLDILDAPLWGLEGFIPIYADEMPVVLWLQTSRAQLVALDKRQPKEDDLSIIALEKETLLRARGIIADSQTVLDDFENLYAIKDLKERSRVIPLGIPDLPVTLRDKEREGNTIEILIVGRLEKRKGTQFLFDIMPRLLDIEKRLRVRFIGADNSQWDGFFDQFKLTYPDYFQKRWPKLRDRVLFEGPVTEELLSEAYRQADIMLVPSLYESFGLIYLEAMRAGLPVVTFAVGATGEIFPQGEEDGALIVPSGNEIALLTAIQDLISDPIRRKRLGMQGRERFLESYLDTRMAEDTAAYYRDVLGSLPTVKKSKPQRIFQVMEALNVGDAVSGIALENAKLLQDMGAGGTILSLHAHPQVADKVLPVRSFDPQANAALIFHYWNYSYLEDFIRGFRGSKAIHFHNITPPEYFPPGSPAYEATSKGHEQLSRIVNLFDLIIGDSSFNLEVCKPYLSNPKPSIVIPPFIEEEEILTRPYDTKLLEQLQEQEGVKFLFVGRIARNKRQDRLIELFDHYYWLINRRAWLYLVGSDEGDPRYRIELEALVEQLPSKDRIVFTGKVADEALYSYYRAADVFICASEHEGFCMPLAEAMAFDMPVMAYAEAAVPETMGKSGILIQDWDVPRLAELVHLAIKDEDFHQRLVIGQKENLERFSQKEIRARLEPITRFLLSGDLKFPIEICEPQLDPMIGTYRKVNSTQFNCDSIIVKDKYPHDMVLKKSLNRQDKNIINCNFLDSYGNIALKDLFNDGELISLRSLSWLRIPDQSFINFVVGRPTLPFDGVPPDSNWKKEPTFLITQAHRLWVTLLEIYPYLQSSNSILDLGAFPFSLDVILRDYSKFSKSIDATTNYGLPDDWQRVLCEKEIRLTYADLDTYVQNESNYPTVKDGLPFMENSIDLVLLTHVIEHLYHPYMLCQEINRLLKPGGRVIITTDNAYMLDSLLHTLRLNEYMHEPVNGTAAMSFNFWRGHNRLFTFGDIRTLLNKSGLDVISINYYEVCYNAFIDEFFKHPYSTMPKWRSNILANVPAYRNEIIVVAKKPS